MKEPKINLPAKKTVLLMAVIAVAISMPNITKAARGINELEPYQHHISRISYYDDNYASDYYRPNRNYGYDDNSSSDYLRPNRNYGYDDNYASDYFRPNRNYGYDDNYYGSGSVYNPRGYGYYNYPSYRSRLSPLRKKPFYGNNRKYRFYHNYRSSYYHSYPSNRYYSTNYDYFSRY